MFKYFSAAMALIILVFTFLDVTEFDEYIVLVAGLVILVWSIVEMFRGRSDSASVPAQTTSAVPSKQEVAQVMGAKK